MAIKFCSFASGSSGNCYMVKDEETAILIDAGISGKKIFQCLEDTDTPAEDVAALLITHEHIDHVKSIPVVTKKLPNVLAYANAGTWMANERPVSSEKRRVFNTGEEFQIGAFTVRPFAVSHDAAEPVGFSIMHGGCQVTILTDSGFLSDENLAEMADADLLVLESNHEEEILLMGRYPYPLKRRILGEQGHLSNVTCGKGLAHIHKAVPKPRQVLLGHLSHENNDPSVAMLAVRNTLFEHGVIPGGDLQIEVAHRDRRSDVFVIEK
ncbi:MAG: MBL fold metallo-hydrolase [Eubacterium sp.]|nr:MBL fold metallo-hydrolase [Candidatus Colimonas fimequi]